MDFSLALDGIDDIAGQVYRALLVAIDSGRLAAGQQLPPSRVLAAQLLVSRNAVTHAYRRLGYNNFVTAQVGRGTFVRATPSARPAARGQARLSSHERIARWDALNQPRSTPHHHRCTVDFAGGTASPGHFPQDAWRACVVAGLRRAAAHQAKYDVPQGIGELRTALFGHVAYARGVTGSAQQVIVTSGAQQAIDLLARVTLAPGDRVAMEDPGYPGARHLFSALGAKVTGIAVDDSGMLVDAIPDDTRLIYVTPAHQFPLGMQMSMARRAALLRKASQIGALIIEDDYDGDFRISGQSASSLQSMDTEGIVAYVGTLSKVMLPELRVGYVVAPSCLVGALCAAKRLTDWHGNTQVQHAVAKFIESGALLRHGRRQSALYAQRREVLAQAFQSLLGGWFRLLPASAGLHVAAMARQALDITQLIERACAADVGLYRLDDFYFDSRGPDGLLLGFGAVDTAQIAPALARVRAILQESAPGHH